jgi:hypothetical protein
VLADELVILDSDSALWLTARPLLDAALRLEQGDEDLTWHGWSKSQVQAFLSALPSPCSLVVGAWDTLAATRREPARDVLVLGLVCKVEQGELRTLGTFASLVAAGLKSVEKLGIGIEDALDVLHYARKAFAPVAWALFLEKSAWDEWLLTATDEDGQEIDKGVLLTRLMDAGRGVLMGSQAPQG